MPVMEDDAALLEKSFIFYIDVFSYCNLRCPSCLVGARYGALSEWPRGLMSPDLLGCILDKARGECRIEAVGLYNWTEPLLHPELPALVRAVKSRGLVCGLSSNLNVLRDPEALLAEHPDHVRVSLSGFTQEIYARGHCEGDIETVKENMRRLAAARDAVQSKTSIEVYYHRYRDNTHELPLMRDFAASLGFQFTSTLAYVTTVEKLIAITRGDATAEDDALLARLAVPLDRALAITSRVQRDSCNLLEDIVVLDVEGNAMLCCGSSMAAVNRIGNFLELPLAEIQRRRREKTLCRSCLQLGLPDYFAGHPEFEALATHCAGTQSG
jgi:MoaA/NifB/PqqE/SkfB family radical SAM enzyme